MTRACNIRALVLDILMEVNEEGQYSHLVLRQVLEKYQYLPKNERAFLTRLTEGSIERRITLDYVIDAFSSTKVQKMKPLIRNLMRLSVYQLLYMDAVPDAAVCNEAVKLAKKRGFAGLAGFVNGVLRSIAKNRGQIPWPDEKDEPLQYLSVSFGVPLWMVELWNGAYGMDQTRTILSGFSGERAISIRVNPALTTPERLRQELTEEGLVVEPVASLPYAFYVSGVDYLNALASFRKGHFYVQDVSSMRVAELAGVCPGDYVIDVCAAPGGKSLHLSALMEGRGTVEARDLTDYKVGLIEENIARYRADNVHARRMDATVHDDASVEKADVVICDLPCSGLGVLAKKPDIRDKMTPQKAEELAALQRRILAAVHDYVKYGGTLVYSTCTIHPAENERNAAWFLREYPEYTLVSQEQIFPQGAECDGFFLAKFARRPADGV